MTEETDATAWSRILRGEWEARAGSARRDYFIASHVGWDDPATWEAVARRDADAIFVDLDSSFLQNAAVLEIGCGVGRLAAPILDRVASYTGVDIAPSLVDEARRRCTVLPRARF